MDNNSMVAKSLADWSTSAAMTTAEALKFMQAIALYFMKMLEKQETQKQLLDFYAIGKQEEKKLLPGEKLSFSAYSIEPAYAKQLYDICKRDNIGFVTSASNTFDFAVDGKGDSIKGVNDSLWIFNTQEKQFQIAVAEAKARSGYEQEIPRNIANEFLYKTMKDGNKMLEIKGLTQEQYIAIRKDIQLLDPALRFTLFPQYKVKDGRTYVDAGFLSKTEKLYDKHGNKNIDPKQYDISELMRGILLKEKILENSQAEKDYFNNINRKEEYKKSIVDELVKHKTVTVNSIVKNIDDLQIPLAKKKKMKNLLSQYYTDKDSRSELFKIIKEADGINEADRDNLIRNIQGLGQELYVVPVTITKNNDELEYHASRKDSLCIGRDLTVRSAGVEDKIISDQDSIKANLDKKLTEYSEKVGKQGIENGYVILTQTEYYQFEMGNDKIVGKNNKLNKKNLKFFETHEDYPLSENNNDFVMSERESMEIIKKINQNKEKFLLTSDAQSKDLERFDEYTATTVENIILEVDNSETVEVEEVEKIKDAINEMREIEIAPAELDFSQYIDTQVEREQLEDKSYMEIEPEL